MLDYSWKQDAAMDAATTKMPAAKPVEAMKEFVKGARSRKIRRNDPCPCGSGQKL
jgi:uncharacterized protein YecA (UPF0149 family)